MELAKERTIRDRLVERGQAFFDRPAQPIKYTHAPAADALLNDFDSHPHAFLLACVMDRQIKAEKAWIIPYRISEKLGTFSMGHLAQLSVKEVQRLLSKPVPLHRFPEVMGTNFHSAVQRIAKQYSGDASRIWIGRPPSAEVIYRFLEFDGVGPKIATMATNLLARNHKIPFSDYYSIDISADVHVRRVFGRLGLCPANASIEQIIYKARALHPTFPGILDLSSWQIGRTYCGDRAPKCDDCYLNDLCPTALQRQYV
jgi:uncharacterized HhH-GPD family protein